MWIHQQAGTSPQVQPQQQAFGAAPQHHHHQHQPQQHQPQYSGIAALQQGSPTPFAAPANGVWQPPQQSQQPQPQSSWSHQTPSQPQDNPFIQHRQTLHQYGQHQVSQQSSPFVGGNNSGSGGDSTAFAGTQHHHHQHQHQQHFGASGSGGSGFGSTTQLLPGQTSQMQSVAGSSLTGIPPVAASPMHPQHHQQQHNQPPFGQHQHQQQQQHFQHQQQHHHQMSPATAMHMTHHHHHQQHQPQLQQQQQQPPVAQVVLLPNGQYALLQQQQQPVLGTGNPTMHQSVTTISPGSSMSRSLTGYGAAHQHQQQPHTSQASSTPQLVQVTVGGAPSPTSAISPQRTTGLVSLSPGHSMSSYPRGTGSGAPSPGGSTTLPPANRPLCDTGTWGYAIVDPYHQALQRVPVPPSAVASTRGVRAYVNDVSLSSTKPCTSIMCMRHIGAGGCPLGDTCHNFHVDQAYVEAARACTDPLCCGLHNCYFTREMIRGCNAPHIAASKFTIVLDDRSEVEVLSTQLAWTVGLDQLSVRGAARVINLRKQVCRLHLEGRCKWTKDCGHVHLCRELHRFLTRLHLPSLVFLLSTETDETKLQTKLAEVADFVRSRSCLPLTSQLIASKRAVAVRCMADAGALFTLPMVEACSRDLSVDPPAAQVIAESDQAAQMLAVPTVLPPAPVSATNADAAVVAAPRVPSPTTAMAAATSVVVVGVAPLPPPAEPAAAAAAAAAPPLAAHVNANTPPSPGPDDNATTPAAAESEATVALTPPVEDAENPADSTR